MTINKHYILKEIFVAFISGVAWLANLCLLLSSTLSASQVARVFTELGPSLTVVPKAASVFAVVLFGVALPYVVGLSMIPISIASAEFLYHFYPHKLQDLGGLALAAEKKATKKFGFSGLQVAKYSLFEITLAHTSSNALGKTQKFAEESQLYASLYLPLPLLAAIFAARLGVSLILSGVLAVMLWVIFFMRYRAIRGYYLLRLAIAFIVAMRYEEEGAVSDIGSEEGGTCRHPS